MNSWAPRRISSLLLDASPGFASGEDLEDGVFQIRMNNVTTDGTLDLSKKRRVTLKGKRNGDLLVTPGDVLFNATNSPELVGKSALFHGVEEPTTYSNHFIRLRPRPDTLDGSYLAHWLRLQFRRGVFRGLCKQWVNQAAVRRDALLNLEVPIPPLPEQRRIAAILDQADALRSKRREALAQLDSLTQSIFIEMFGDPCTNPKGWGDSATLGDIAEVVSGVTKGRRLADKVTRSVPYLAVANVQDRSLDLTSIKSIEATDDEIARYLLKCNDLLLTEGGDPDKLGRGTLWADELHECIHQNHIFRVRLKPGSELVPLYLNWLVGSERGKRYFLRSAKQTTGIASINMTQLRGFPLLAPPMALQMKFLDRIRVIQKLGDRQKCTQTQMNALFASLQHRAFRGEL